jgi:hypothetical protein
VPAPNGRAWSEATLRGKAARGTGLLRAPIYAGRLVWNRHRSLRDPDTGERVKRANPAEETSRPRCRRCASSSRSSGQPPRPGWRRTGRHGGDERGAPAVLGAAPAGLPPEREGVLRRLRPDLQGGRAGLPRLHRREVRRLQQPGRVRRGPLEARVCEALGRELMDPELAAEFARAFAEEWTADPGSSWWGRSGRCSGSVTPSYRVTSGSWTGPLLTSPPPFGQRGSPRAAPSPATSAVERRPYCSRRDSDTA